MKMTIKVESTKTGSLYIRLEYNGKKISLKDAINKKLIKDDIKFLLDYKVDLIKSVKSKLQFNKIVEHKVFFTKYKDSSISDIFLYLHTEFDFNIYPAGHKIR